MGAGLMSCMKELEADSAQLKNMCAEELKQAIEKSGEAISPK